MIHLWDALDELKDHQDALVPFAAWAMLIIGLLAL